MCFLGDAHAGVSCRVQLGAPPGRRSQLSIHNHQLSIIKCWLWIDASLAVINCSLLIPPFPSRRVQVGGQSKAMLKLRWCFLGDAHAGVSCRVQLGAPLGRRSQLSIHNHQLSIINYQLSNAGCGLMASLAVINCSLLIPPFPSRRVQVGGQSKAMLKLRWCFLGDAHAGVSCRVQLGAPPRPGSAAEGCLFVWRSSAGALAFIHCFTLRIWRKDGLRRFLHGERDARGPRAPSLL